MYTFYLQKICFYVSLKYFVSGVNFSSYKYFKLNILTKIFHTYNSLYVYNMYFNLKRFKRHFTAIFLYEYASLKISLSQRVN